MEGREEGRRKKAGPLPVLDRVNTVKGLLLACTSLRMYLVVLMTFSFKK